MSIDSAPVNLYMVFFLLQVSYVMAALQDSSRGTQACINAASVVSGIIGDLDKELSHLSRIETPSLTTGKC